MTQGAVANGMDPEGAMNTKSNLVHGRGSSDLQRPALLCPIRRLHSKLVEEVGGIDRHELVPLGLWKGSETLTHGMRGTSEPPCEGMVEAMSVTWHVNYGSWMSGFTETPVDSVGVGT